MDRLQWMNQFAYYKSIMDLLNYDVKFFGDGDDSIQLSRVTDYFASHSLIRKEIRTSTSSMSFVAKPLKFVHPHYGTLDTF